MSERMSEPASTGRPLPISGYHTSVSWNLTLPSTLRKQGLPIFAALRQALTGDLLLPVTSCLGGPE